MKTTFGTTFLLIILLGFGTLPCQATEKIQSLCQFSYPSDHLVEWQCVRLTRKDTPYRLFGKNWQDGLRFNRMDRRHFVAGVSIRVPKRMQDIAGFTPLPKAYPDAEKVPKFILIDQNEMYLGAYEFGKLVFSTPVAVGAEGLRLRNGSYHVDAVDRQHESSLYPVEGTERPYPMHYGLRFYIDKRPDGWTSYWLHGRDVPGYPASHGCIGLYDEEMQRKYYHEPDRPVLMDARRLYRWAVEGHPDSGKFRYVGYGPKVLIIGAPQVVPQAAAKTAAQAVATVPSAEAGGISPGVAVVPVAAKPAPRP